MACPRRRDRWPGRVGKRPGPCRPHSPPMPQFSPSPQTPGGCSSPPRGSLGELGSQPLELEACLTRPPGIRGRGQAGRGSPLPEDLPAPSRPRPALPDPPWRPRSPGSDACPSAHSADGTRTQRRAELGPAWLPAPARSAGPKPRALRGGGVASDPRSGRPGVRASARGVSARPPQPGPAGSGLLLNKGAGGQWPLNWAGALAHRRAASCPR